MAVSCTLQVSVKRDAIYTTVAVLMMTGHETGNQSGCVTWRNLELLSECGCKWHDMWYCKVLWDVTGVTESYWLVRFL